MSDSSPTARRRAKSPGIRTPASTAAAAKAARATPEGRARGEVAATRRSGIAAVPPPDDRSFSYGSGRWDATKWMVAVSGAFALMTVCVVGVMRLTAPPYIPPEGVIGNNQLGAVISELRELGRSTSKNFAEMGSNFADLGSKVVSLEAATASSQSSVEQALAEAAQAQKQAAADARADGAKLAKRLTAVEERTDATIERLEDRIKKLEEGMAEQRNAMFSAQAASQHGPQLSPDWATTGVGARIDYSATSPALGRSLSRQLVWSFAQATSFLHTWQPGGSAGWPADVLLEKNMLQTPGRCWSVAVAGNVTVQLPLYVRVDAVGVETLRSGQVMPSAPKDVKAWTGDLLLADWDVTKAATAAVKPAQATNRVTFQVLANNGDERFTCLYRVNVHGEPVDVDGQSASFR